jgi:glycosyltransferase involved in cell wall biosynthesis
MSAWESKKNDFDDVYYDVSKRAEAILDHVLDTELNQAESNSTPKISVDEALHSAKVLDSDYGRSRARVVFVTTEESTLINDSLLQKEYISLSSLFDELHIMVLIARSGKDSFVRVGNNLWVYQIHHKHWWQLPSVSLRAAKDALIFNGSVRPDVIVGVDPFEAGLAAYYIARDFERPLQIHINSNFYDPAFDKLKPGNWWRRQLANYLLKRVASVRTKTANLKELLVKRFPKISDFNVLPRFYNFAGLTNAQPAFDVHQKYKDFVFIMLAFGPLSADSHLHSLFSALRKILVNQRIGLIVVGDGPAKGLFEDKVKILGIEKSVVFKKELEDLASYLKTADLLVETDTSPDSEVLVMQAAAAGLPMIAFETEMRLDLFEDGKSALLCKAGDLLDLGHRVTQFINSSAIRVQLRTQAQAMASSRLQENAESYYLAYRDTIERILFESEVPVDSKIAVQTNTSESHNVPVDSLVKQA